MNNIIDLPQIPVNPKPITLHGLTRKQFDQVISYHPETGHFYPMLPTGSGWIEGRMYMLPIDGRIRIKSKYGAKLPSRKVNAKQLATFLMTGEDVVGKKYRFINQRQNDCRWCNIEEVKPLPKRPTTLPPPTNITFEFTGVIKIRGDKVSFEGKRL